MIEALNAIHHWEVKGLAQTVQKVEECGKWGQCAEALSADRKAGDMGLLSSGPWGNSAS